MNTRPADTPIGTTRANELNDSRTASDAREKARELAGEAKDRAREMAAGQKDRATGELGALAAALRDAGGRLESENHATGRLVRTAADRLDRLSDRIEGRDIDSLMREGRMYARSNPALFIGGAIALGFFASRFFKASSDEIGYSGMNEDRLGNTPMGYDSTPSGLDRTSGIDTTSGINTTSAIDTSGIGTTGRATNPSGTGAAAGLGTAGVGSGVGATGTGNVATAGTTRTTGTTGKTGATGSRDTTQASGTDPIKGGSHGRR